MTDPLRWIGLTSALIALLALGAWLGRRFLTPVDHTWMAMQDRGVWRVGMDPSFPPFEALDGEGNPVGYDVDLAREIAGQWGMEVQIVAIGFDGLLDALMAEKVDSVVSALPFDPRMTQDVHYSSPYFEAGVRLVVRPESPIAGVEDLSGKTIAVEWGSAGDVQARRLQRENATIELRALPTPQDAIRALVAEESDALLVDGVTLRLAQGEGNRLKAVGPALESDPYVFALPIDAPNLQEAVEDALDRLRTTGRITALEMRWFGPNP